MNWPFGHLQMFGYDVCVVDPPTEFETYSEEGNKKSGAAQYDVMSWDDIAALPVGQLVRANGIILLWACPPTLRKSLSLFDHWGALYKTELVWPKKTKKGKIRVSTGYRSRGMHESVLLGAFGNEHQIHNAFFGVIDGIAREHSRKPDEFYDDVIQHTQGLNRCELFARQSREGFDTWGNEATKFDNGPVKRTKKEKPVATTPLFDQVAA